MIAIFKYERKTLIHMMAVSREILEIFSDTNNVFEKWLFRIASTSHRGNELSYLGRVTHICVSKLTIIGSDNGLSPRRRQAIIWTNAGILSIGHIGTNFNEILIEIHIFSFKKMRVKISSAKWRPFCLGLNVLTLSLSYILMYAEEITVMFGAGNGSLPDDTKPLPIWNYLSIPKVQRLHLRSMGMDK